MSRTESTPVQDKRETTQACERAKKLFLALFAMLVLLAGTSTLLIAASAPLSPADAAIYVGDTTIEGYQPDDIARTDMDMSSVNPTEAAGKLENVIVRLVKFMMPFLMIACVGIIIYNAIRNLFYFRQQEKKVKMGELLKNMIVQYFFILGAFIIVELIVFAVSGGQSLLFGIIMGA